MFGALRCCKAFFSPSISGWGCRILCQLARWPGNRQSARNTATLPKTNLAHENVSLREGSRLTICSRCASMSRLRHTLHFSKEQMILTSERNRIMRRIINPPQGTNQQSTISNRGTEFTFSDVSSINKGTQPS